MKKVSTLLLILVSVLGSSTFGQSTETSLSSDAVKIRSKVKDLADSNKRVVVTTASGQKIKGNISLYDDEKFTITDGKTGSSTTLRYAEVRKVSKSGGISTAGIVAIAAAGTGAVILLTILGKYCRNEGGC